MNKVKIIDIKIGNESIYIFIYKDRMRRDLTDSWHSFSHNHYSFEFHYITHGTVSLAFADPILKNNDNIITLKKGDACIISPFCYHNTINYGQDEGRKISFNFNFCKNSKLQKLFECKNGFELIRNLDVENEINSLVYEIVDSKPEYSDISIKAYFMLIFSKIIKVLNKDNTLILENVVNYLDNNIVDNLMSSMMDNFFTAIINENLKLSDFAEYLGLSEKQTSRILQKQTGKTYTQLVLEKRIQYAKMLLVGTEISVEEISARVNFSSSSNFIRAFKKVTDMTPAQYRVENKKE